MSNPTDVFAERLLQVIDEGQRTATYKLALLLALIDACAEETGDDGGALTVVHTRSVARHVLRIYLPQVRGFLGSDQPLRQITMKQSAVLGAVLRLHLEAERHQLHTVNQIERALPDEYERCLDVVEQTFARYPLRLLQVVGREDRPFLYDIDWGESVSLRSLHTDEGGSIRFKPGAGDHLLRLAPLIRPLIELHWTRMVARLNDIGTEEERLREHLFGADRVAMPRALRNGLAELQGHACFYCQSRLGRKTEVDHFIPWARSPNDAIENLVLADACNNQKRDFLPALVHVDRWNARLRSNGDDLQGLAGACRWDSDPPRSVAVARSCYAHLPNGTPLWLLGQEFVDDEPSVIAQRLSALPP